MDSVQSAEPGVAHDLAAVDTQHEIQKVGGSNHCTNKSNVDITYIIHGQALGDVLIEGAKAPHIALHLVHMSIYALQA